MAASRRGDTRKSPVAAGTSVVLAGHSNTERGFLPVLRRRLAESFDGDLDVRVARSDRDPFVVV